MLQLDVQKAPEQTAAPSPRKIETTEKSDKEESSAVSSIIYSMPLINYNVSL